MRKTIKNTLSLLFIIVLLFPYASRAQCSGCALPTGFTISSISNTSANLSWTAGSFCNDFEIYVYNNFNYTLNIYTVTGTTYTLTGLDPLTPYTVTVAMHSSDPISCLGVSSDFTTTGEGIGCPCESVIGIIATNIKNTEATISWSSGQGGCDDYYVTYTDPRTGISYTYVVIGGTSLTIPNLAPGTMYTISIAVISNNTPPVCCIPTEFTFETTHTGLPCYECAKPLSLSIINVTTSSADLSWIPGSLCRDFDIYVYDNTNSILSVIPVTGTSYSLTGLNPGCSYTITVAQRSYIIPGICCLGISGDFLTEPCDYFPQPVNQAYVNRIIMGDPIFPGSGSHASIPYSGWPTPGLPAGVSPYMKNTTVFNLVKNVTHDFGWDDCQFPYTGSATIYVCVWLDLNYNNVFEPSEKIFYGTNSYSSNPFSSFNCLSRGIVSGPGAHYTTPNLTLYNVKGRCIVTTGSYPDPCGPLSNGQALDFFVNIQ